jgi:hypothetical protein
MKQKSLKELKQEVFRLKVENFFIEIGITLLTAVVVTPLVWLVFSLLYLIGIPVLIPLWYVSIPLGFVVQKVVYLTYDRWEPAATRFILKSRAKYTDKGVKVPLIDGLIEDVYGKEDK